MRPNKKYGFRKFICKIENKESHQRKVYCTLPPLAIYNLEALEKSLNNPQEVIHAFPWRNTPQGAEFWANIQVNLQSRELPQEAEDFLKYCLNPNNHYNIQKQRLLVNLSNWIMRENKDEED